jgi:hypothetical protein
MGVSTKAVPLIRIIFFCTHTHTTLCRVAYGVAPVDSQKGKSGGRKEEGGERGGELAKNMWATGKDRRSRNCVCGGRQSGSLLELTLSLPSTREGRTRKESVDGRMVILMTTYHLR